VYKSERFLVGGGAVQRPGDDGRRLPGPHRPDRLHRPVLEALAVEEPDGGRHGHVVDAEVNGPAGLDLARSESYDAVVLAVPHDSYLAGGWSAIAPLLKNGRGVVLDVRAKLDREKKPEGVELWRL